VKLCNPVAKNIIAVTLQTCQITKFLGAFAKLRKATICFVMCVHPFACNNSVPTGRIFMEFDIWGFSVEKIQVSLKSDKNKEYFTWRPMYILHIYFAHFYLEWETFRTEVVENIKTHILCSVTIFRKSCRLWNNVEKYWARQATYDNMAHAHCMLDSRYLRLQIHTLRLYNIRCFSTTTIIHERASMLRHTYTACLVNRNFKTSK